MQKTAKIVAITGTRPRESKNGTVHYISVEMDNGDKGTVGKKTPDALKIGDELTYTLESKEHNGNTYYSLKEIKKEWTPKAGGSYSRNYKADYISFALSYAKDLAVAGKIITTDDGVDIAVCEVAETLYARMCKTYDEQQKPAPVPVQKKDENLPF
jgi:hypothetical protein